MMAHLAVSREILRKRKGRRGRNHDRLYIWTIKEVIDIIYSTKDFKEKNNELNKRYTSRIYEVQQHRGI